MEYYVVYNKDYLMHHGVKGMHWGVRRYQNYDGSWKSGGKKQMKADFKYTNKALAKKDRSLRKEIRKNSGIFGPKKGATSKVMNLRKQRQDVEAERIKTHAEYNKNLKGEKAEFKTYVREMNKTGQVGSYNDMIRDNHRATRLYADLTKQKGKSYANNVVKKNNHKLAAEIIGGTAIVVGASAARVLLESKAYSIRK